MTDCEKKMRQEFGVFLRNQRQKSGLTQLVVAKACGLSSAQFISNIERGICPVPSDTLVKMSELYNLNKKDLAKRYNRISLIVLEQEMGVRKETCA